MKEPQFREIPLTELEPNKGQIEGLPANPRSIQPELLPSDHRPYERASPNIKVTTM